MYRAYVFSKTRAPQSLAPLPLSQGLTEVRDTQTSFRLTEVMTRKTLCVRGRSPNKRGPPNFGIHTQYICVELSQALNPDVDRSHPKQPATNLDWPVGLDGLSKAALEGFLPWRLLVANLDAKQSLKPFHVDGANMSERRLFYLHESSRPSVAGAAHRASLMRRREKLCHHF